MNRGRTAALAVAILIGIAAARVGHTWTVLSQTFDEPFHVAAGFQWLSEGRYDLDPEHPPLPRIFFAIDAWLSGAKVNPKHQVHEVAPQFFYRIEQGNDLFYRGGSYLRNVAGARAGNLPFLAVGIVVVYLWTRRIAPDAAVLAAAIFSAVPAILAHAGLATTDMAAASTIALALYALELCLEEPSWRRVLFLGVALGLALASKMSFLVFFPAGAVLLFARHRRLRLVPVAAASLLGVLLLMAAYRFESARLNDLRLEIFPAGTREYVAALAAQKPNYWWVRPEHLDGYHEHLASARVRRGFDDWARSAGYPSHSFQDAFQWVATHVRIPGIRYVAGVEMVRLHSTLGHGNYLLGQKSYAGWWYYFPLILFFKTPLPFLGLALAGIVLLRRQWAIGLIPLLMLAAATTSNINIGVRHVLPLYPFLSMAAAVAALALWKRSRPATIVLLGWFFLGPALAHPDYLAWFNEAALDPPYIAADSNLDWGQDLLRLAELDLQPLHVAYFGSTLPQRHIPHAKPLPDQPVRGWIAVSEMVYIADRDGKLAWLARHQPVRRVGKSIRLYFLPSPGPEVDPRGQQ